MLPIGAIYRHIVADRCNPDHRSRGVLCVTVFRTSGMSDTVVAAMGKYTAAIVRNLLQPILDVARIQAETGTKMRLNSDKSNRKRKVSLECAAAVQFMRTLGGRHSLQCPLRKAE